MALHQREICKVGDSPSRGRRSVSPRRMMSVVTEDDGEADSSSSNMKRDPSHSPVGDSESPRMSQRLMSSPCSSTCSTPERQRSPSRGDRRISTRLLMQKSDKPESVLGKMQAASSPQSAKPSKQMAWKTSKFFSRSMASGELLRGLKKLSSPSGTSDESETKSPGTSESKSFKNRFSSLRRKSGSDTETVSAVDKESLKLGSSGVRGIVCKKEDLISLLTEVSKERRVSSPSAFPASSPTPPLTPFAPPSCSPLIPGSPVSRGSFRSSRSASMDPTMVPNEKSPFHAQVRVPIKTIVHQPTISRETSFDEDFDSEKGPLEVMEVKRRLSGGSLNEGRGKENVSRKVSDSNGDTGNEEDPAVQWDDSNFVDPTLLGGAIEAFLKGMGSGSAPSGGSEKRVSFKKS